MSSWNWNGFDGPEAIQGFFDQLAGSGRVDLGALFAGFPTTGVVCGSNPLYQVDDFLAIYPKFGSQLQAIVAAKPNATTPGSGYAVNDLLSVVLSDAQGGVVKVTTVAGGVPTSYSVQTPGTGYSVTQGLSTTGGAGTGALVDVTQIDQYSGVVPLPVLQLYINLAQASLMQARWQELWPLAMALYVAHFCTLYLRSEGNIGSTPGQIAASGLAKGIAVSKSAGGVSVSNEVPSGLEGWGAFQETEYGLSLITFAKSIGSGPIFVW